MSREDISLGEPHPSTELAADFPRCTGVDLSRWYRAHSDGYPAEPDRGCWWFASIPPGDGRFDLAQPEGTCYFADNIEAAVRERLGEVWGTHPILPPVALDGTTVSSVDLRPFCEPEDIADTQSVEAAGYVTREISAGAGYGLTQRHAAAFLAAGFSAIAYAPRFTPGAVNALALFGSEGRPRPSRGAAEVSGWTAELRTKVRRTVTRARARVIP
ncbi:RES family NAD+ phosphorylase [Tessaracoccus sp. MC1679]|uniref:RES family NAD+ phosphorylase n=1 Tax=Tessaracoccus sp. MC1679 TaxID=2760313 RepID=UPI0016049346|nr:RES family NAD+ phosphorylase [Tessaracoccus sp. MC1679]